MKVTAVHFAILAAFAASGFLVDLGGYPLLDNNEGLYARIALEMLDGGDWIIPHLLGLPYLEKPPLLYWLTAGSFALLGKTETAARLVPALSSLSVVACAYWLGARSGRALEGWIAGLVISTSVVTVAIGRTLYFDMLYTALLSFALGLAYFSVVERRQSAMRIAAGLLGLAVLAKGLAAVGLCGVVLAGFLVAARAGKADWARFFDPVSIAIFLAVAGPWHVAAALADGEFAWLYFVNEHVGRLLGTREPADYYRGAPWYYFPRLFAYAAPWSLILPLALWRSRNAIRESIDRRAAFLWSWLLGTLVVFSLAGNKANYYMIVAIVPLASIVATRIAAWVEVGRSRYLWTIAAVLLALSMIVLVGVDQACGPDLGQLYPYCEAIVPRSYVPFGMMIALLGAVGFFVRGPWRAILPIFAIAVFAIPLRMLTTQALEAHGDSLSQAAFARRLAALDDGRRLFVFAKLSDISSFAFYFDRRFGMLESVDPEFHFPMRRPEANGLFLSFRAFDDYGRSNPVYVVAENWRVPAVRPDNTFLPYCVVMRTRRVALLSNVPQDCLPG